MLKLTKEHRQPRKAAKPKQPPPPSPPPPPIVAPRQPVIRRQMGMEVLDQEGGVSQEIPRPFYPGFLSALPGLQQNNDLKKELVPIYKILEESVRVSLCPSFKHTPPTHACLLFLFLLSSTWKLLNLSFVYYSLPVRSLCCVFRLYLSPCFSSVMVLSITSCLFSFFTIKLLTWESRQVFYWICLLSPRLLLVQTSWYKHSTLWHSHMWNPSWVFSAEFEGRFFVGSGWVWGRVVCVNGQEKLGEKLQKQEEEELRKVKQLAQELQEKQFWCVCSPSLWIMCSFFEPCGHCTNAVGVCHGQECGSVLRVI